ncbi:MAG: hypothetical protein HY927_10860 [Elusimicrobia bacterium]|nr:hypothetical protein [Elusimicrobiota bacterium]
MNDLDPPSPNPLRGRIAALLAEDRVREAVQEYHALIRESSGDHRLRVEFAGLLAKHGWKEEAFQQIRQALSLGKDDDGLVDDSLEALDRLGLPAAKSLAAACRAGRSGRRWSARQALLAGAVLGSVLAVGAVLSGRAPAERDGPDLICREFSTGSSTSGLAGRARELKIARLVLLGPTGLTLLDKPLRELGDKEWKEVQDQLRRLEGRAVFTNPPSVILNRWCAVDIAGGRVIGSLALRHAP